MKILLIKFMHIGDVLLITPLIKNLAHYYPDAKIDVALNSGTEQMLCQNPNINSLCIYPREEIKKQSPINRLKMELDFIKKVRKQKYDLVINLTSGDRGIFLSMFSGAKEIVSFPSKKKYLNKFITKPIKDTIQWKHWVDINLLALKALDKKPVSKEVKLFWDKQIDKSIDEIMEGFNLKDKKFVHFHPLSRWFFKCIKDELSAKIIDFIEDDLRLKVVITSAPDKNELEKIENILKLTKSEPINLSGELSLKETSALNSRALAFVGVDTAIMHISASNDVPTLAFFGPSIPYAWGPWDNSKIINEYSCYRGNQKMGKHKIIQKSWECVPCDAKGCKNSGKSDCLLELDFNTIKNELRTFIKDLQNE